LASADLRLAVRIDLRRDSDALFIIKTETSFYLA